MTASALCGENKNDEPQREHRGSQELIGVVQPWEGMPFRRAVHLIWRAYGTAEQAAEKRACATNRCHSGFKAVTDSERLSRL